MLATIICGSLLVLSIAGLVISIYTCEEWLADLSALFIIISFITLLASILSGYVPVNGSQSTASTNDVIMLYENCPCAYHLDLIEKHNNNVNAFNNLWCRFKIEDRSEYIVDIDALLNKENNNEKR